MADDFTTSSEEDAGQHLLRDVTAQLASDTGASARVPADFATRLFGQVIFEDLAPYSAAELAGLTRHAWDFLKARKPGTPKIRLEDAPSGSKPPGKGAGTGPAAVSLLEIVNDDMPFLVDSVLSELSGQ